MISGLSASGDASYKKHRKGIRHMSQTQLITRATHGDSLADILERVLNTGLVIAGDIRIKLCDVELLSIQLRLLICSVEKAQELGISWWWQTSPQTVPVPVTTERQPSAALSEQNPASFAPEDYREFREFQRFRQVMQTLERGPAQGT
jgi:hypothetical protein